MKLILFFIFTPPMPAENNTNLGLTACFQANTLFRTGVLCRLCAAS